MKAKIMCEQIFYERNIALKVIESHLHVEDTYLNIFDNVLEHYLIFPNIDRPVTFLLYVLNC